jgi:aryl-alcohol dehydrogenase-like predicted oxidoreductase
MRYFEFEPFDKKWSVITFGCWQIGSCKNWGGFCSPKNADKVIRLALDHGITAFDTAKKYGDGESERRLGKALGNKKYETIIISKIWPTVELNLPKFMKQLDSSLQSLDRDYLDVYLVHWPGNYCSTSDTSKQLCDIMISLKESGKVKSIGLSNFHYEMLKSLGKELPKFSINQVPYNLLRRGYEGETLKVCKSAGISYMAYSPLAQGLLAGVVSEEARKFVARKDNRLYQEPYLTYALNFLKSLEEIAKETNKGLLELALAWVRSQENVSTVIVGAKTQDYISIMAKAGDFDLSKELLDRMTSLSDSFPMVKKGRRNPPENIDLG